MSYIEGLKKSLQKYATIGSEQDYWDFATDSQVGELFHTINLAQALYQYDQNWGSSDECQRFLTECESWVAMIFKLKQRYDPASKNLTRFFRFGETITIYLALLKSTQLTQRALFQYCIALSVQFTYETAENKPTQQAATALVSTGFSRKNIKYAWKCIQTFLATYHAEVKEIGAQKYFSRYSPKAYFRIFIQSKDIAFPVAFAQAGSNERENRCSLEECRIWLDIQLKQTRPARGKMNLIALNSPQENTPYEDRLIGETIEKAVVEALDFYNRDYSPPGCGESVRSIFFQIGKPNQSYDGASIGCAAFFAVMTRLTGRHLPRNTFYTGKIGCDDNAIEEVVGKALAGWKMGFSRFVVPGENLEELIHALKTRKTSYSIYQKGGALPEKKSLQICPYRSLEELCHLWEDLTSTGKPMAALKVHHVTNLPLRNPHFTGRDRLFDQLAKKFQASVPIVALSGLGGIGKTEISIEYAYRCRKLYSLVWRVRGEELSTIIIDYARLAQKLNLPQKDTREEEVILDAVREWLEQHAGWLLIFDNVETPKNLFNENMPILPRGGGGHVLITSRYHNWDEWCEHAVVKKFAADESLAFLLKRTRQKDRKTAEKLAEQVGHLPLALAQAAAYIRKQEIKLADYLELFNQERDKLWTIENAPRNYPYTIATTWKIAMARIRLESSAAVNLLNFISIHAPDDIPIALLLKNEKLRSGKIAIEATNRQAVASIRKMTLRRFSQRLRNRLTQSGQTPLISLVNNAKDDFVYQDAIIALKSYSLVEGNLDSLSVHNLVQMVTRDNLEKESNREWCEIALTLMDSVFPAKSGEAKNWPLCSQLFPHAIAVSNLAELFNVLPKLNLSLLFKLGEYLSDSAQYEKAEAIYRQTLKIARKVHPDKHAELSHIHRAIGLSLEARDFYEAAYKQYKKALEIDKRLHGDKGAEIAVDQSHLGAVSLKWGKLDDALAYYQNALKNNYNAYNERHPVVIINRNNLGKTFSARGHFELAENHFDHALEMAKGYFGHNHPFVAEVINNLGDLRLLKGNLAEAKTDFEFALEIHQNTFGDEHPRVAEDLNRIGTVLMLQSDPRGAENLFTQALEINREIYGNQHHAIARDINSLGCLEKKKGNLPAAIDFFKQALAISKSVFKTTHHPFIAEIANNYGTARLEQADYEEARKYIELALSIHRKSYRPNHPIVARGLISLARVYHLENKLEQAKKNYFIAYDILANRFVKNHPDLIELRTNLLKLADDYNGLSVGQNRKSDNLYCPQAVTIYRKLDLMATK